MNKSIGLWLGGFLVVTSFSAFGQSYAEEALTLTRNNPGGSARIQGMGGAQVALGGDYSTAYSNPAGLGFFNRSEFTLSIGTNFYNSSANYLGTSTSDSKSNANLNGLSLVLHNENSKGKMLNGNFAVSLTRTKNFNQNITYQSANSASSMIDYFIGQSSSQNSYDPDFFPNQFQQGGYLYYSLAMLGFDNFLFGPQSEVTPGGDSSKYHTYVATPPSLQKEQLQTTGSQYQWNFAYGLNFSDFFYVGAALGIPSFNYTSQKTYQETFSSGPLPGFQLNENLHITGTGVNGTIGAIIKPKDFVQFGLSVSTPTYYPVMSEDYTATMKSNWNGYNYIDLTYPSNNQTLFNKADSIYYQSPFLYSLTTPWRIRAGATVFIQKHGLITAEIEKVNYSKPSFGSNSNTPYDFSGDNSNIRSFFKNVFNIRVGGEYRYSNFRFRLGYSYAPSPYNQTITSVNNSITSYSAGVGYRTAKYFVDLGLIQSAWNSSYLPYSRGTVRSNDDPISSVVSIKNGNFSAMVTVGFNL
ncbi:MAG: hypothetical protein JST48_03720 [Bacteroidetes bacterium]|nr:hypothetical protein [Bacteroidota bacterium]